MNDSTVDVSTLVVWEWFYCRYEYVSSGVNDSTVGMSTLVVCEWFYCQYEDVSSGWMILLSILVR